MSVRKTALIFALAAASLSTAQAQSTSTFVGGEIGFIDRPVQSTLTREQVRQEMLAFRANPVSADGSRYVGGEIGYEVQRHAYARIDGQWACVDGIAHNAKPDAVMNEAERRLQQQRYPA